MVYVMVYVPISADNEYMVTKNKICYYKTIKDPGTNMIMSINNRLTRVYFGLVIPEDTVLFSILHVKPL